MSTASRRAEFLIERRTLLGALLGGCVHWWSGRWSRDDGLAFAELTSLTCRLTGIVAASCDAIALPRLRHVHTPIADIVECLLKPADDTWSTLRTHHQALCLGDHELSCRIAARIVADYQQGLMVQRAGWWLSLTECAAMELVAHASRRQRQPA